MHHRRPGVSELDLMIFLCPKCHAKVERTQIVLVEVTPLLLELWRERHPEGVEQLGFNFTAKQLLHPPPLLFDLKTLKVCTVTKLSPDIGGSKYPAS